jgi:hypothetical protein
MHYDRIRLRSASVRIAIATFALAPIVGSILLCTGIEGKPLGTVGMEAALLLVAATLFHVAFTRLPRSCEAWLVVSIALAAISIPWYFLCLYAFQNHPGGMPTPLRFELLPLVLMPATALECIHSCQVRSIEFESGSFKHRYLGWICKL